MTEKARKATAVDLFAGAGGLSLGFSSAGFQIVHAVEADGHAARTYARNHVETRVTQGDIAGVDPMEVMRSEGFVAGELTALVAGLPCQGFSESNRRTRTLANPRNHLYEHFIRFASAMRPNWVIIENVAGLQTLSGGSFLDQIKGAITRLGYRVDSSVLSSLDFGVPQVRRRVFIIGTNAAENVPFPPPTHGEGRIPFVTVRDAISDLPILRNGAATDFRSYRAVVGRELSAYQALMRRDMGAASIVQGNLVSNNSPLVVERYGHIRQGGNWEDIPRRLMRNYDDASRCHTGIYHRLYWDRPSKVIGNFRKNMLIHPTQNRGLSVREAARLQSFPDNYEFVGSVGFQQQQVADAVPPLLAKAVAVAVIEAQRAAR